MTSEKVIPIKLMERIQTEIFKSNFYYSQSSMCTKDGIISQVKEMLERGTEEFKIFYMIKKDSEDSPLGYNIEVLSLHVNMSEYI